MPTDKIKQSTDSTSSSVEQDHENSPIVPKDPVSKSQEDLPVEVYLTENRLGTGSHGNVFKVRACGEQTTKIRAMKVFSKTDCDLHQQSLERDIPTLLRKIQETPHNNIISVINLFATTTNINLVMNYADLGSLEDLIKVHGSMDESILAILTNQVLQGLGYLHATMNMVHGSMTPSNVLLFSNGSVKISSPLHSKLNSITNVNMGKSNRHYYGPPESVTPFKVFRAPAQDKTKISEEELLAYEQKLKEEKSTITVKFLQKGDIWALGLIVAEAFFGRFPIFESDSQEISEEEYFSKLGHKQLVIDFPKIHEIITQKGAVLHQPSDAIKLFVWAAMSQPPFDRPPANHLLGHAYIKDIAKTKEKPENAKKTDQEILGKWFKDQNIEKKRKASLLMS